MTSLLFKIRATIISAHFRTFHHLGITSWPRSGPCPTSPSAQPLATTDLLPISTDSPVPVFHVMESHHSRPWASGPFSQHSVCRTRVVARVRAPYGWVTRRRVDRLRFAHPELRWSTCDLSPHFGSHEKGRREGSGFYVGVCPPFSRACAPACSCWALW